MAKTWEYDFLTAPNGGLPNGFGYAAFFTQAGQPGMEAEPQPGNYYTVVNGRALFNYTEEIVGVRTTLRGLYASPGFFAGTDALLRVSFDDPLQYWDNTADGFLFQLGIGYRGKNMLQDWVGGLLEASWTPSGWNPAWKLRLVKVTDAVLATVVINTSGSSFQTVNELHFKIVGKKARVSFNGIDIVQAEVDFRGEAALCLMCRVTTVAAGVYTSYGVLRKVNASELDSGVIYPKPECMPMFFEPDVYEAHFIAVPIPALEKLGAIKQLGPNVWQFTREVVVDENAKLPGFRANEGDIIVDHRNLLPENPIHTCKFKHL